MKKLITLLALFSCVVVSLRAQEKIAEDEARWQSIISTKVPADARMSAQLYQLAVLAREDKADALQRLRRADLLRNETTDRINVEVVYRNDENVERLTDRIDAARLRSLGIETDVVWRNRASAWMGVDELMEKAALLGPDYFIFSVPVPHAENEGPGVMNSAGYHNPPALSAGQGRRVAIIDNGYFTLPTAISSGAFKTPAYVSLGGAPSTIPALCADSEVHGAACAEVVYDHAPGSTYELYLPYNTAQRGAAVDTCIAHGVNIISMSLSEYNLGWFDNTGAACAYTQAAVNAGLLYFTACGNRAQEHYQSTFNDANGNGLHEYPNGDERNIILDTVQPGKSTHAYLSWIPTTGSDFDIFIYNRAGTTLLASAVATGTGVSAYESVSWTNNTSSPVPVCIVVKLSSGPATQFEYFTHSAGRYQWAVAAGSNTSPSNNTHPNVVSVGAVYHVPFADSSGASGIIESYSSQGPTNGGALAPKITGPTGVTTLAYGGGFFGTSCATPNAAGATAAFWAANPGLDATGVRQLLNRFAHLYKDFGAAGVDNLYGNGGLFLYPWASNQRYMLRSSENTGITNNTRPFQTLLAAEQLTPVAGTVVILNSGNYSETGLYGTVFAGSGKSILYRSPFPTVTGAFGF